MDGGAWWAVVSGVAKSWTRLSDLTFTFHFHALEKEMATHPSVLGGAWWAAIYGVAQSQTLLKRLSSSSSSSSMNTFCTALLKIFLDRTVFFLSISSESTVPNEYTNAQ